MKASGTAAEEFPVDDDFEEPTPDDICEKYADLGVKVTVTDLDDELVLFKATREGLEFLAELFWAQAHDPERDSNHLSPRNPGSDLFTKESTRGIYIRRIDPDTEGS